jgi:uncharacterized protein (TIGR02246 family)
MKQSAREAILRAHRDHVVAVNSRDADLLLSTMTEDIVYIGPEQPPLEGHEALREYVTPIYEQASIDIQMEIDALEIGTDRAVERGRCWGELSVGDAPPTPINLQYLFVYRLEADGQWRVSHDIFNEAPPR